MKNNEIIAEYIGMQKTNLGWFDAEENLSKQITMFGNSNTFDELLFDKSYDWIFSVLSYLAYYEEVRYMIDEDKCEIITKKHKVYGSIYSESKKQLEAINEVILKYIIEKKNNE